MRDHRSVDDEGIQATLAGIAAELEESDRTDRSHRLRFALAAGLVLATAIGGFMFRSRHRGFGYVNIAAPSQVAGEVATPVAIDAAPPAIRPAVIDTTGPLSRDTVSNRRNAHTAAPRALVSAITVDPSVVRLRVARTATLTATLSDADGDEITGRRVAWTSSKPQIATVSSKGVVRARSAGTVTITAKSGAKRASVLVIVTRPPTPKSRR
jgi:hypothetical protein